MHHRFAEHLHRAGACFERGDLDGAERIAKSILQIQPNELHGLYLYGFVMAKKGKPEKAVAIFGQALRIDPGNADLLANLAKAQYEVGNFYDSAENYQ